MSFCSLTKGITPKICRLCFCVLINHRSFEPFTCFDLNPLCVDSARALWASFCFRFVPFHTYKNRYLPVERHLGLKMGPERDLPSAPAMPLRRKCSRENADDDVKLSATAVTSRHTRDAGWAWAVDAGKSLTKTLTESILINNSNTTTTTNRLRK